MTAHLPGLVQVLPYNMAGLIFCYGLTSSSPHFLVILCGHISVFYKKASEIKHVNFAVDILVYHELKNVFVNEIIYFSIVIQSLGSLGQGDIC